MAKTSLTLKIKLDGAREILAAFRQLPKDASASLRTRTLELSKVLADRAAQAARSDSRQSALLAGTVKATRDRVPSVQVGGARRVGRNRAPAWGILFGSEFGMNSRSGWYAAPRYDSSPGDQYRENRGRQGYWFFPIVDEHSDDISRAWRRVVDDVIRQFGES